MRFKKRNLSPMVHLAYLTSRNSASFDINLFVFSRLEKGRFEKTNKILAFTFFFVNEVKCFLLPPKKYNAI